MWKKKYNPILYKKSETLQKNFFLEKKKTSCIFFFPLRGKKKTKFWILNEWMSHELSQGKKKIRYLWLGVAPRFLQKVRAQAPKFGQIS